MQSLFRACVLAVWTFAVPLGASAQPAASPPVEDEETSPGALTLSVNESVQRRFDAQMAQNKAAQEAYDRAIADFQQSQSDYAEAKRAYEEERARIAALKAANDEEREAYAAKAAAYDELIASWPKSAKTQSDEARKPDEQEPAGAGASSSDRCAARPPTTGSRLSNRPGGC